MNAGRTSWSDSSPQRVARIALLLSLLPVSCSEVKPAKSSNRAARELTEVMAVLGDCNSDGLVNGIDGFIFGLCQSSPGVALPTEVLSVIDGQRLNVTCGLADLDADGDVDQSDWGLLQRQLDASELWGDVNGNLVVDCQDVKCAAACYGADWCEVANYEAGCSVEISPVPAEWCATADLDGDGNVTPADTALLLEAIVRSPKIRRDLAQERAKLRRYE